jgi:hypothetical protein
LQPLGTNNAKNIGMIFWGMAGTPTSSTATGLKGQMMWDVKYVYFLHSKDKSTNYFWTVKRLVLSSLFC